MQFGFLLISTFISLILVDMLFILGFARHVYEEQLTHLLKAVDGVMAPNWIGALVVYILITLGIIFFVLPKADSYTHAFLWGAFLGVILYGVYDFTNYALLSGWPLYLTIVEVAWGGILCGVVSLFAYFIQRWLNA